MTFALLVSAFVCGQDPDAAKDQKVDIKVFVPTREPKTIPEDLRAPGPFDDDYPIPQDRTKADARRKAFFEWHHRQLLKGFDGDPTAKWHAPAKTLIEAVARLRAAPTQLDSKLLDPVVKVSKELLIDGCEHPLVMLLAYPHHGFRGEAERGYTDEYGGVVDQLLKAKFSDAFKALLAWETAVMHEDAKQAGRTNADKTYYVQFWKHTIAFAATTDAVEQEHFLRLIRQVHARYVAIGQKRSDGWAAVADALKQGNAPPIVAKIAEAEYCLDSYRELINDRTNEERSKQLAKERLAKARTLLTEALAIDAANPVALTDMVTLCVREKANREEMEAWFAKAMTANADNLVACLTKLNYFADGETRNEKAMVTFGRQCVRTNNDAAFLGQVLVLAHTNINRTKPRDDFYLSQAEPWADCREVYETRLKRIPECRYSRSAWGLHCLNAGEGPGALHNLRAVKNDPWPSVFSSISFSTALREAEALARSQMTPP